MREQTRPSETQPNRFSIRNLRIALGRRLIRLLAPEVVEQARQESYQDGAIYGTQVTGREMMHVVNNAFAVSVGATELALGDEYVSKTHGEPLREGITALIEASKLVNAVPRIEQVVTKESPMGPALDIGKSLQKP